MLVVSWHDLSWLGCFLTKILMALSPLNIAEGCNNSSASESVASMDGVFDIRHVCRVYTFSCILFVFRLDIHMLLYIYSCRNRIYCIL